MNFIAQPGFFMVQIRCHREIHQPQMSFLSIKGPKSVQLMVLNKTATAMEDFSHVSSLLKVAALNAKPIPNYLKGQMNQIPTGDCSPRHKGCYYELLKLNHTASDSRSSELM